MSDDRFPVVLWAKQYEDLLKTEIEADQLRRWKEEALKVLADWEVCYDLLEAAGFPAPIGGSKAVFVAGFLRGELQRGR